MEGVLGWRPVEPSSLVEGSTSELHLKALI